MRGLKGTARGKVIELDEPLPFEEGTRVDLDVRLREKPPKGSPQAWLRLVGTLSEEEAEAIMRTVEEDTRRIDPGLWTNQAS